VHENVTVTSVLFHPFAFAAGEREALIEGADSSMLTPPCAFVAVFPALSAQVPVADWFDPSVVIDWLVGELTAPDVASEQFQLNVTLVLFQPLAFAAGD
jgi:hypothetical protein